jgi:ribose 5-phosphate isomerase A
LVFDNVGFGCEILGQDPVAAGAELKATVGVVEHGIFIGMTTAVIIAGKDGITVKTAKA